MTANTADNFLQIPHNGAYGNLSYVSGTYSNLATTTAAAGDTYDFVKVPAGAVVLDGFLFSTQMTGTSTWAIGVRYADGTSTGGTTGTNVMLSGTSSAITGLSQTNFRFMPFANDADTIIYATHVSGPVHTANDNVEVVVRYDARGTR